MVFSRYRGHQDHPKIHARISFSAPSSCRDTLAQFQIVPSMSWFGDRSVKKLVIADRWILKICHTSANKFAALQLTGRLFNVEIKPADGQAPVWHKDVRFFKVFLDGKPKAYFYLDPYSRPAGHFSIPPVYSSFWMPVHYAKFTKLDVEISHLLSAAVHRLSERATGVMAWP